ncbi:MAG: Cell shape-determining protein MreC [Candidatus Magasanikbacteria bacterium GW2011_GWC2_40_17]|uniref:Cell shape-determining protein MreC n=1 Tax=Candidatus Magasanikbacteria bacterium GW2011_GWA2_42_32 TaxID=1619039 RepID=A0A0G1A914_9BACT|nr:MAG: Cell shape-determining protein MreC [Candidatus Magasanikbacteria bacterium GW2011_GWC2_40_17]KKS57520.1 MAG: Cell shape-determining protein MreC [Candidatus Magasanikbacteria bacterium GW2011_GWA2_42_32]OGH85235.1 MAG: rod shape-determining protein MreC [Candidatus Magasanikbacteria bacterium RIFOXYB2_FULL_38_10]
MFQKKVILISFLFFFIVIFFHYQGWFVTVETALQTILGKGSRGVYTFNNDIKNYFARWVSYRNLFEENKKCLEKISSLSIKQGELAQIQDENKILRSSLNFLKKENNFVMANVIGKAPDPINNVLLIDKGLKDGLKEGLGVLAEEGILIGKIIKVEEKNSQIRIITDNESKIAVSILNPDQASGIMSGEHNLRLLLTMIPLTENIKPGDKVVTSNLDSGIKKGMLIGQIESVQKELYQPFQSAIVKPAVDLNKLNIIYVLLD